MSVPVEIRISEKQDAPYLVEWFSDPKILFGFPIEGEKEIQDTVRIWMDFVSKGYGLTAVIEGKPCGMAVLYIQSMKKLSHTCLLSILVEEGCRGKGVGTKLLSSLARVAKEVFGIEILHLEVYAGNPARHLYERMGFVPFGEHPRFSKEEKGYRAKVCMQKYLR